MILEHILMPRFATLNVSWFLEVVQVIVVVNVLPIGKFKTPFVDHL